jgi:pimeloyl-ACP methyl ester carboxylesterase
MSRRLLVVILAVVGVLAGPGGLAPARADDGLDHSCATSLGGTLPVVFVHGWRKNAHDWDTGAKRVLSPGVTPIQFDYEKQHTNWVTDPHIGPALAKLILCLGRNSELSNGPGKVVLVGHSMGGLAIRCALQVSCSQVIGAADYVAQVITIGTPTHGSYLRYGGTAGEVARMALDLLCEGIRTGVTGKTASSAAEEQNLCQSFLTNDAAVAFNDGSSELKALRAETPQTPVLAIAGDIKLDMAVVFGRYTVAHGDGVVDQRSQHSWATETADVDCGRIVLGGSVTDFGYALRGDDDQFSNYKCWHMAEPGNADVLRIIRDKVNAVNAALPRPDPRRTVRFDGIGDLTLSLTAGQLETLGFVNQGNLYEGMDVPCVSYAKTGFPFTVSVESKSGRVLAINNSSGDAELRTQVGNIRVGSTLAQIRSTFHRPGYQVEEKVDLDFGQGSNGVIVDGPGGSIGLGLEDTSAAAYASGQATVSYVVGVGTRGNAPTLAEDGC